MIASNTLANIEFLNEISVDGEDNKKVTKEWVDYLRTHEKYAVNPSKKKKNKTNLELCFK